MTRIKVAKFEFTDDNVRKRLSRSDPTNNHDLFPSMLFTRPVQMDWLSDGKITKEKMKIEKKSRKTEGMNIILHILTNRFQIYPLIIGQKHYMCTTNKGVFRRKNHRKSSKTILRV